MTGGPLALFYDVETTGLPLWNEPSDNPRQPHVVEIAALLRNRDRSVNKPLHAIIRPDGWVIPEAMTKIHGISQERALAEGRPALDVFRELYSLWYEANFRVAHNESFDARMVRIALLRHVGRPEADRWKAGVAYCTAILSEPICQLPPTERMIAAGRGGQFKKPKLEEAYRVLLGKEHQGAHGAMADCEACFAIYHEIWRRKHGAGV